MYICSSVRGVGAGRETGRYHNHFGKSLILSIAWQSIV